MSIAAPEPRLSRLWGGFFLSSFPPMAFFPGILCGNPRYAVL